MVGNGPSQKGSGLLSAIQLARQKGIVVVALSQCLHGAVSLDTYSMGREFIEAGEYNTPFQYSHFTTTS